MFKQFITPILGVGALFASFVMPVQATTPEDNVEQFVTQLGYRSSLVYCNSKDRGVSETQSIENAYLYFVNGIQEGTGMSDQEAIQMANDPQFQEGFEVMFNRYALENCPEHY